MTGVPEGSCPIGEGAEIPTVSIDIRTVGLLDDPFEFWDEVREKYGKLKTDPPAIDGEDIWVLMRYEDVYTAHRNTDILSNRAILGAPYFPVGPRRLGFVETDPPIHTPWRQQVAPYFSPRAVERRHDEVKNLCRELIHGFHNDGGCEFISQFATVFPTAIFLTIAGQPQEDRTFLLDAAHAISHMTPEADPGGVRGTAAMAAVQEYMAAAIADRRVDPKDDFITALTQTMIDGEPASEEDILGSVLVMFFGGLDTVAGSLAFQFHFLAEHPDYRRQLIEYPEKIPGAVEEFLRVYPIIASPRVATRDVEYLGCPLKAGDRVWLQLAAANRDPSAFPNGNDVDFERQNNKHMTFGVGVHRCLGSNLARAELKIVYEEWHKAIPNYWLRDPATVTRHGGQVVGFNELPLQWA